MRRATTAAVVVLTALSISACGVPGSGGRCETLDASVQKWQQSGTKVESTQAATEADDDFVLALTDLARDASREDAGAVSELLLAAIQVQTDRHEGDLEQQQVENLALLGAEASKNCS